MYSFIHHCNFVVIKGVLEQLPKTEFIKHAYYIRGLAINHPWGTRRAMYLKAYGWCQYYAQQKWGINL